MSTLRTKDVIAGARLLYDLDVKDEIVKLIDKASGMAGEDAQKEIGIDLLWAVLGKAVASKNEKKVYAFIGSVIGKSANEIADMEALEMVKELSEVAKVEEWIAFFSKSADILKRN